MKRILVVLAIVMSGCATGAQPTPITIFVTAAPSASPSLTPTPSPTPTESPTPTPSPTLVAGCAPSDMECLVAALCDLGGEPPAGFTCPTPAPPSVLASFKGTGNTVTKPFKVSVDNDSFDVAYTFDCRKVGYESNFIVHLHQGSDVDYLVNELGKRGAGTVIETSITYGTMRFSIESDCSWTLKVLGLK